MTDEYTVVKWLITVFGALAGLIGVGVSLGQHRQRINDHERRLVEVEQDLHTMAVATRQSDVAIARLESTMLGVVSALDRIEKKLDRA